MAAKQKKVVIVLGMHRSGTSMVTGLLNQLGVYMGDDLLPADENNPLGYYEDAEFLGINKGILEHAGGSWQNPPPPEKLTTVSGKHRLKMEQAITRRKELPLWGFKDPRTCLTAHLWDGAIKRLATRNIYYLNVIRNGSDVVSSLEKAHGLGNWDQLVVHYQLEIGRFIRSGRKPNVRSINYTTIMRDPSLARHHLMGIVNWLELDVTRHDVETAVASGIRYPQVEIVNG